MASEVPVFETAWMQEAYQVRDRLVQAGIWAEVVGHPGPTDEGGGRMQVVVPEEALAAAREVLVTPEAAETAVESESWPCCPQCGTRRTAVCPICKTAAIDFPEPDEVFVAVPDPLSGATPGKQCGSGSGACAAGSDEAADEEGEPSDPPWMLLCTTCDEPFVPRFAARCGGCDHTFDDGLHGITPVAPEAAVAGDEYALGRVLIVLGGLTVLVLVVVGYFAYILR